MAKITLPLIKVLLTRLSLKSQSRQQKDFIAQVPGEHFVDLLLGQVLGQLLHLGLRDVAVLVLVVKLERKFGLKSNCSRMVFLFF